VACAGAVPIGATNCLNFGNPERPEVMWQFAEAVAGLGEACRALEVPITGGNVSLYNETDGQGVQPTPVIGIVGLLEDAAAVLTRAFPDAGLDVVLLGESLGELGGSEYLKSIFGLVRGGPPALDLARERALQRLLAAWAGRRLIRSAHDCADGGLAVTLCECCFDTGGLGAEIAVGAVAGTAIDPVAGALFGESASRVLVSVPPEAVGTLLADARAAGVPAMRVGRTGGDAIRIAVAGRPVIDCSVQEAEARWSGALAARLDAA